MAFDALSFRNMAVSLYHAEMALLASDPSGNILLVVEAPTFDTDVPFRLHVAGGASSDGARDALLFSLRTGFVIVADEAIDFMNRQMFPLNELGMAAGTAELHSPSQLAQMFSVREGDVFVNHVSLQIVNLMAALLQAACIADLGVRRARSFPRKEIRQGHLAVDPFPLQMIQEPRFIVTFRAGDLLVA